jgi:peptidyl-prolyl cis-trans isomerase B (cyclophilin B)
MPKRLLAVLALLCLTALAGCSDDGGDDGDSGKASDTSTSPSSSPSSSSPVVASGVNCDYTDDGLGAAKEVEPPPNQAEVSGQVAATMATTLGDFHLTLDADAAPCTVNSFVSLATQGYFDDTTCHRLTTTEESGIAVLQCGDPTGTGSGGPGYVFNDELTGSETYPAGTLAMANRGPNTNGSQFFIVYGDTPLNPDYTVFGNVDDGTIKAIAKLAKQGTVMTESGMTAPKQPVDISSVTIS